VAATLLTTRQARMTTSRIAWRAWPSLLSRRRRCRKCQSSGRFFLIFAPARLFPRRAKQTARPHRGLTGEAATSLGGHTSALPACGVIDGRRIGNAQMRMGRFRMLKAPTVQEAEQIANLETWFSSSESWELQQHPRVGHSRAGGGAVHSISSGPCLLAVRLDRAVTASWHENNVSAWAARHASVLALAHYTSGGEPWPGPSSGELSMSRWSQ
jgi:hypothetical protein